MRYRRARAAAAIVALALLPACEKTKDAKEPLEGRDDPRCVRSGGLRGQARGSGTPAAIQHGPVPRRACRRSQPTFRHRPGRPRPGDVGRPPCGLHRKRLGLRSRPVIRAATVSAPAQLHLGRADASRVGSGRSRVPRLRLSHENHRRPALCRGDPRHPRVPRVTVARSSGLPAGPRARGRGDRRRIRLRLRLRGRMTGGSHLSRWIPPGSGKSAPAGRNRR